MARVEHALQTSLDQDGKARKRRTVGAQSDRGTWVRIERRRDLESRDGKVMSLFACAKIAGPYAHPEDPRLLPAQLAAEQVMEELQRD
jgi:hypothetical protein